MRYLDVPKPSKHLEFRYEQILLMLESPYGKL